MLSDANGRFCFAFDYPESWERTDPDNGDGIWIDDPRTDVDVQGTFSGRFSPETFLESDEEYEYYLQQDPELWQVSESYDSPGSFGEGKGEDESLVGWRVTVVSTDHVADPMMETRRLVKNGDFYVSFSGAAPESVFAEYEPIFDYLAESLTVIEGCEGF